MEKEVRTSFLETEFRANEDEEKLYLDGYFIRFNEETELYDDVFEAVSPDAVVESLASNDIRCLFNHDTGTVLGRTGNNTLTLTADEKGLFGSVEINKDDSEAMAIYSRVKRGDINACSFGFYPVNQTIEERDNDETKITLNNIDLFEVSVVTFPAYPQTEVNARNQDILDHKKHRLDIRKQKLKERLK
ncbi:HK97 family phage prohead protease [Aerococcus viridans]